MLEDLRGQDRGGVLPRVAFLVQDATHMFLEGSPEADIELLLVNEADEADYGAPVRTFGTVWPWAGTNRCFSVRASSQLFERLAEAASHHAELQVCSHVHFYRGKEAWVQWYDAFSAPLLASKMIPRERVERFTAAVGGTLSDDAD